MLVITMMTYCNKFNIIYSITFCHWGGEVGDSPECQKLYTLSILISISCDWFLHRCLNFEQHSDIWYIYGYLYRICRSLLITGKNPSGTAGYSAINLGINNLSATVKTDIANRSVDCFMMSVQLCFQNEL